MKDIHEIDFLASQVKTWEGEVTVARIQSGCKVGYQKAVQIAAKLGVQDDSAVPDEHAVEEAAKQSVELAIVEAASLDVNPGIALGNLLKNFDLGESLTCCRPLPETTDIQIGEALRAVKNISSFSEWAWGDLINELERRGHQNVVDQVAAHFHMENQQKWLYSCATVAERVPVEHRSQSLHFSHFSEIATKRYDKDPKKNQEKIIELIKSAEKEGWNTVQTRAEAKRAQGKEEAPTPPPEPEKPKFLVVDRDSLLRGEVVLFHMMKEPLCDEAFLCINQEFQDRSFSESHRQ